MMFVCLASRHTQISLDLMMESDSFFFLNRVREEERKKKMETEGWRGSAAKLCLSLFFSAFLPFFFVPLSLPYTKALMCAAMCFAIVLCLKA